MPVVQKLITCAALSLVACATASTGSNQSSGTQPSGSGKLLAFPGAEGFGAFASGGRGGRILHVITLAAQGPGSLQEALDQTGPRTIVFDVSGLIEGWPTLESGDVTIAGQSSPGGVILRGLAIQGDVVCEQDGCPLPARFPQNFVVRHLRLRPAASLANPTDADDALRLHRAKNGIIDHVSAENASDEAMQISMSSDITIQDSILAETLGDHVEFGGMLVAYTDPTRGFPQTRLSIHHNVWNRIFGRLPEFNWENFPSDAGSSMEVELSNNVMWDPHRPIWMSTTNAIANPVDGPIVHYRMNAVGNYFAFSPGNNYGMFTFEGPNISSTQSQLFFSDNRINLFPGVQDFQLVYGSNDFDQAVKDSSMPFTQAQPGLPFVRSSRHPFPAITYQASGEALLNNVVTNAGAFPRDPMDRRLMGFVQRREFDPRPLNINPETDAFKFGLNPPNTPLDTDRDGMPDAWETQHGLNPKLADNNGIALGKVLEMDGYTNLEVYLAQLSQQRIAEQ